MKVSLEWLKDFVDLTDITPEQIAHELTMSGLEVEEIEKTGACFTNIITAKIEKIDQHPNADKLHLVTVNTGSATKTVVCGAQNIEEGQIIPYASVGSKVLNRKTGEQFELTPAIIRGVESQGMLCSADELGVSDKNYQEEDGILILNRFLPNVQIGRKLEEVLGIKEDIVFDIAPTANRGDQMSIVGVARELAALFNKKLRFSFIQAPKDILNGNFKVEIKDDDVCKYYSAGILENVVIKPSPEWMQNRLQSCGIRAINNVVDITNYVLLEYGQPLHAFDKDKLNGYLCVRRAENGEKIVTLDDVERTMTTETVVIATKEKSVCIAGVFGSANSEIDDNTKNIVLESAYFTPATNRRSSRSVGYRSEACARFERGVDMEAVKPALMRAMQLLVDFADAKVVGITETGLNKLPEIDITLRFGQIKRILGCEIPSEKCIEILGNLGFELLGKNDLAAKFRVPSFRRNDVTREIDLIEEVARINGYDKVTPTLPAKTHAPTVTFEQRLLKKINDLFLGYGFYESVTSSLVGKPLMDEFMLAFNDEKSVCVKNPQSEDHTTLRQTLIPNMLQSVKYNLSNGQKNIWLYEIGRTYLKEEETTAKNSGVKETRMLSGVVTGSIDNNLWITKPQTDFYALKGVIEGLFELLGLQNRIKLEPCTDVTYLHPGKAAKITLMGKGMPNVGCFGLVHPLIKDKEKFNQEVYVFELDLDTILANVSNSTVRYKKLPQFPEVQRDFAFIVNNEVTNDAVLKAIKKYASNNLFTGADIFDLYQGEHVQKGFKSVAYRIKFQDENATLTDEVIEKEMKNIKDGLKKSFADISFRE